MVLEGASPTDTFRDDSSPASDSDPFGSSPNTSSTSINPHSTYALDSTNFWKPLPLLGPIMGYTQADLVKRLGYGVSSMRNIVRRELSEPEVDAVCYHAAKGYAFTSYGVPIGALAGYYRYRTTKLTFRFPFYKPDLEKFNPEKLGPLRGAQAKMSWHLLRALTYSTLGSWFGKLIVGTYAATVVATGMRLDPRLKDCVASIQKMGNEEANSRRRGIGQQQVPGIAIGNNHNEDQDHSPYNESSAEDMDRAMGSNTGGPGDQQKQPRDPRQQPDHNTPSVQNRASTYREERVASQSQPDSFDFDDESPTASNSPHPASESAWARLRRDNAPPQSRSPPPSRAPGDAWAGRRGGADMQVEQREGSTVGDAYAFSKNEEERQGAREQAQREFDERLERERRGEEFGGDGRDGKWR